MRRPLPLLATALLAGTCVLLSCAPEPAGAAESEGLPTIAVHGATASPLPSASAASGTLLPADPSWSGSSPMQTARAQFAAVLLSSGEVVVAGGVNRTGFVGAAEIFDPLSGTWRGTTAPGILGNITSGVLLPSGQPLVMSDGSLSGRVFNPATETWAATGPMASSRSLSTMTVLRDGRVLVAGGSNLSSAELFDSETGTFTPTGSMAFARRSHTAAALRDGRVLVTSGFSATGEVPSAELYDPASGSWSMAAPPLVPRHYATATLLPDGRVLLAGGFTSAGVTTQAELYDPAANTWTATGALNHPRNGHTATLLPSGKVLVIGGSDAARVPQTRPEIYDPATGTWTVSEPLQIGRENHVALLLPTGKVLVAGGFSSSPSLTFYAQTEVFAPAVLERISTGPLSQPRTSRPVLLPTGKVLLAGGHLHGAPVLSSELFDPASLTWSSAPPVLEPRAHATTTLLETGDVLVVGGAFASGQPTSSVERYWLSSDRWSGAPSMAEARSEHTAARLRDGSVLVVGGRSAAASALASTERFVPEEETWAPSPFLAEARRSHAAARLPDGGLLVAGGVDATDTALNSVEFLAAGAETWLTVSPLSAARSRFTLTLLADGRVLAIGGASSGVPLASAELFDPETGTWTATGSLSAARAAHAAVLMPTGKVWVAGGLGPDGHPATHFEIYDPTTGAFSVVEEAPVSPHLSGVSLPTGEVLFVGPDIPDGSRLYGDTGAQPAWRPRVTDLSTMQIGCDATLTGSGFRGISEGGSGSYLSSPSNVPVVRLMDPETGELWSLPTRHFSSASATVAVPPTLRPGTYGLTLIANGIPGGRMVEVARNLPPTAQDADVTALLGTPTDILLVAEDPDENEPLSWHIVIPPEHGTLSGVPPELTYTPDEGFRGSDGFTYQARDCGLVSGVATVTIQVVEPDTTPPTLSCPDDQTLEATDEGGAIATWPEITASDDQDPAPTVVTAPRSGSAFSTGDTEVVATATDAAGNSATCSFTITVIEPQATGCNCQSSGSGGAGAGALSLSAAILGWLHQRRRRERWSAS